MVYASYDMTVYKGEKSVKEDEDIDEDEEQETGLCCLSGCLTGTATAILFVIVLPAGILLTFYAANNNDLGVLSAGIILIAIPILSLPLFIVLFYNRRRLRRMKRQFRKRKVTDTHPETRY